jgi:hypothetical protein
MYCASIARANTIIVIYQGGITVCRTVLPVTSQYKALYEQSKSTKGGLLIEPTLRVFNDCVTNVYSNKQILLNPAKYMNRLVQPLCA